MTQAEDMVGLADMERILAALELKVDSGRRTVGGGNIGFDGAGGFRSQMWGNEPIMVYRNPDGPKAAALIRLLARAQNTGGGEA